MTKMKNIAVFITALAICSFSLMDDSKAAGFLVYDISAEALAKGGAVSAAIESPPAIWFNPSAMSFIPGYQFSAGTVVVSSSNEFTPKDGGDPASSITSPIVIPHGYATFEILDWMHAGIGLVSPFGLGITWPEDWIGRDSSIYSSLRTMIVNPALSFKVWKNVSVAAGFSLIYGAVDIKNGIPEPIGGTVRVGGTTWAFGGNAAVTWRIFPDLLHAAFAYRSRATLNFDGKADFEPGAEEFAPILRDQEGKASINLPDVFTFGLMYRPIKPLAVTFDVNLTMWSVFDKLALEFEHEETPDTILHRNWKNSFTVRLGFDYTLPIDPRYGKFQARMGFIFDENPSPKETLAPSLPDATRLDLGLGAGYSYKWLSVDVGYLLVYFLPSESTTGQEGPEGTYRSMAHLMGLTLTGRFGTTRTPVSEEYHIPVIPEAEPEPKPEIAPEPEHEPGEKPLSDTDDTVPPQMEDTEETEDSDDMDEGYDSDDTESHLEGNEDHDGDVYESDEDYD